MLGTDRFHSKWGMPEARVVLKEEFTHACPLGKLMPSTIRLQDALLTPLKQLQIIEQRELKIHASTFILSTAGYSKSPEDSELCTI